MKLSICMRQFLLCLGVVAFSATAAADDVAENTAAEDITAAQPSLYSAAYLPPKPIVVGPVHNPYEGAVASTSTNIIRTPGNLGQVAAFSKTVETPFSSVHKADVRYTNDVQPYHPVGPYPYPAPAVVAGPYPYVNGAAPYPYAAAPVPHGYVAPVKTYYGYGPPAVPHGYGYGPSAAPYAYGPVAAPVAPHAYAAGAPLLAPHSVTHSSFSGPYGSHYSYKR